MAVSSVRATLTPQREHLNVLLRYEFQAGMAEGTSEIMLDIPPSPIKPTGGEITVGETSFPLGFPIGPAGRVLSVPLKSSMPRLSGESVLDGGEVSWSFFRDRPGVLHFPAMIPGVPRPQDGDTQPTLEIDLKTSGLEVTGHLLGPEGRIIQAVIGESSAGQHLPGDTVGVWLAPELSQALSSAEAEAVCVEVSGCAAFLAEWFGSSMDGTVAVVPRDESRTGRSGFPVGDRIGTVIALTEQQLGLLLRVGLRAELARRLAALWWGGLVKVSGSDGPDIETAIGFAAGVAWAGRFDRREADSVIDGLRSMSMTRPIRDRWVRRVSGQSLRTVGDLAVRVCSALREPSVRGILQEVHANGVGRFVDGSVVQALLVDAT